MSNQRSSVHGFSGNYATWNDAERDSSGYATESILETVKNSLLKVKNGEFAYERDGVLFDRVDYAFPLLAFLLRIAMENDNRLGLVDFGGSLGTTWFQNRAFLSLLRSVRWGIVEQANYVACGKAMFTDNELSFHETISDAASKTGSTAILCSGVIGYVPEPAGIVSEIMANNFRWVIFDRTAFIDAPATRIVVQHVTNSGLTAGSYPARLFNWNELLAMFGSRYEFVTHFGSYCDHDDILDGIPVRHLGFVLRKR